MNPVAFGKDLRALRESKGLSVREVERLSGVSFASISRYEIGKMNPSPEALRGLAKAYGVPYVSLLIHAGYITESEVMEWLEQSGSKN